MVGCVRQGTTSSLVLPHSVAFFDPQIKIKSTRNYPTQLTMKGALLSVLLVVQGMLGP